MPDKTAIAVGLDAGSAQTRCLILAMEEGRLAYLGHGEVESTGWSKSRLVDQKALTACVQSAVRRAEMESECFIQAPKGSRPLATRIKASMASRRRLQLQTHEANVRLGAGTNPPIEV